jgi:hypothetical protein
LGVPAPDAMDKMDGNKVEAQWAKAKPKDADGNPIVDPTTLGAGTTCYTADPEDGGTEIPDCLCHKSCDTCKLTSNSKKTKPQGQDNCLTCRDGLYLNKLTTQGLARCDTQPCAMFCLQSAEVRTPPGRCVLWISGVAFTSRALLSPLLLDEN